MPDVNVLPTGTHLCLPKPGALPLHKLDDKIPCSCMFGRKCEQHHCEIRLNSFADDVDHTSHKGAYRERRIDAYDARRETAGDAAETMQALGKMESTILTGV